MQRLAGMMLVASVVTALVAGCALRDPRVDYAYSRASDGLWGDTGFELIDWNFPTSLNQPPVEGPKRLRGERTAIGVTWATRNPLPLSDNLAPFGTPASTDGTADDRNAQSAAPAAGTVARGVAAVREPRGTR
ncbi:MAG: hypothetical protein ABI533_00435 [Betaproteobacteria bacterium]